MKVQQLGISGITENEPLNIRIEPEYDPSAEVVLYQGDTRQLICQLPDRSVKLIVSSPPYNLGKEYETRIQLSKYVDTQAEIISEMSRTLDDTGSICWQVGNYVSKGEVFPLDIFYYQIFKDLGFKLRNRIIWHFGHGLHAQNRFSGRYETILWFTKSDQYTFNLDDVRVEQKYPGKRHFKGPNKGKPSSNPKGKNPSDFWGFIEEEWQSGVFDIPNVKSNHPEKTIHPCQFPIELVERCVLALTDEGDRVFDPFAGVGSTIIAGIRNNRKAIAAEQNEQYVQIARERIAQFAQGKLNIREIGTQIHKPSKDDRVAQKPIEWQSDGELL
ncbi:MAG: site-specific DNA-methyltransferase [Anaerolineales bacterium]|nr:site-specific DNA-methyltransferase [Anaerolineales bacterium]